VERGAGVVDRPTSGSRYFAGGIGFPGAACRNSTGATAGRRASSGATLWSVSSYVPSGRGAAVRLEGIARGAEARPGLARRLGGLSEDKCDPVGAPGKRRVGAERMHARRAGEIAGQAGAVDSLEPGGQSQQLVAIVNRAHLEEPGEPQASQAAPAVGLGISAAVTIRAPGRLPCSLGRVGMQKRAYQRALELAVGLSQGRLS
jgi:hypothetical protein